MDKLSIQDLRHFNGIKDIGRNSLEEPVNPILES